MNKDIIKIVFLVSVLLFSTFLSGCIKQEKDSSEQGTWLFAMDTPTENVGSNEKYRTGYIPTLVVIDVNGYIV
ncbi:MAG: hypothetical protein V5A68_06320, partial [Candidatus Thermoplasmatota archaeon]